MATKRNVSIEIKAVDHASGTIKKISNELKGVAKPGSAAGVAMNQAATGAANVTQKAGPAAAAVNKVGVSAKGAGVGVGAFAKALGPLGGSLTAVTGALGGTAAAVAAAAAAVGFGISKWLEYAEVFGQIGNMAKLFGQDSKQVVADINSVAKSIGDMTGKSTTEIADIGSTVYAMTESVDKATAAMKTFAGMAATLPKMRARSAIMALTEAYDGDSKALEKLAGFTGAQIAELDKLGDGMRRAERATQMASERFDKMAGTADKSVVAIANMKKEVGATARMLGETFGPAIVGAAKSIQGLLVDFQDTAKGIKKIWSEIAQIADVPINFVVNIVSKITGGEPGSVWDTIKDASKYNPFTAGLSIPRAAGELYRYLNPSPVSSSSPSPDFSEMATGILDKSGKDLGASIDKITTTFDDAAKEIDKWRVKWETEHPGQQYSAGEERSNWMYFQRSRVFSGADAQKVQDKINSLGYATDKAKKDVKEIVDFTNTFEFPSGLGIGQTSGYGPRKAPVPGASTFHPARDYGTPKGTPLLSIADAIVKDIVYSDKGYGNRVVLEYAEGLTQQLSHLNDIVLTQAQIGQPIPAGTLLGHTGSSGIGTGPHLDRKFMKDGVAIDVTEFSKLAKAAGVGVNKLSGADSFIAYAEALEKAEKEAAEALLKEKERAYAEAISKAEADLAKFVQSNIGVKIPYSSESVAYWNSITQSTDYLNRGQQQHRIMKQLKTQAMYDDEAALLDWRRVVEKPGVTEQEIRKADVEYSMAVAQIGQQFLIDTEEMFNNFEEIDAAYKTKWFEDNFGLWDEFLSGLDENANRIHQDIEDQKNLNKRNRERSMNTRTNYIEAAGPIRGRDIYGNFTGSDFDYAGQKDALNRAHARDLADPMGGSEESINAKYDKLKQDLERDYYNWQKHQEWYFTQFSAKELNKRLLDVHQSESDKQAIRTEFQRRARDGEIGGTTAFKLGLQENFNSFKTYQEMMVELGGQTASSMQTAFGDLFVDAFRNDLDGAKDIFDEFTRTIIDSWVRMLGQMAAQQIGGMLGFGNLLGKQGGGSNPFSNPAFYSQMALPTVGAMAAAGGSVSPQQAGANIGSTFGAGWAGMAQQVGAGGNAAGAVAGSAGNVAAVSGGKGIMGGLGKALGWLGIGLAVASLFKKGPGASSSGPADPLKQFSGINQIGGGLDVLRGSSFYTRAAFSPRNADGSVIAGMANLRTGNEQTVKVEVAVKPSGMFETEVSNIVVEGVRIGNAAGVPRRTGFTHG